MIDGVTGGFNTSWPFFRGDRDEMLFVDLIFGIISNDLCFWFKLR